MMNIFYSIYYIFVLWYANEVLRGVTVLSTSSLVCHKSIKQHCNFYPTEFRVQCSRVPGELMKNGINTSVFLLLWIEWTKETKVDWCNVSMVLLLNLYASRNWMGECLCACTRVEYYMPVCRLIRKMSTVLVMNWECVTTNPSKFKIWNCWVGNKVTFPIGF